MIDKVHDEKGQPEAAKNQQSLPIEVAGNQLSLFTESSPYLAALEADIRTARKRVWIESYTIADDLKLQAIAAAIRDRAAAGVDCRVTYDAVGSLQTASDFFEELTTAGVRVYGYRPFRQWWWRPRFLQRFQRRNHRKLAVIDDDISYFGGMNLADVGGSATPPKFETSMDPAEPSWRDVHIRMVGEATSKVAAAFVALRPDADLRKSRVESNPSVEELLSSKNDAIYFVDSRPLRNFRRPGPFFIALIGDADSRIRLAMAYFLPFGGVLKSLRHARNRGIEVEVILPAKSDVPIVNLATQHMYDTLLRKEISIYERQDQMLHSKAMIVDEKWSVVGSCNFDPRSMLLNLEFFSIIRSKKFADQLSQIFDYERSNSIPVCLETHRKRSWFRRLLQRIAWSFRRWL